MSACTTASWLCALAQCNAVRPLRSCPLTLVCSVAERREQSAHDALVAAAAAQVQRGGAPGVGHAAVSARTQQLVDHLLNAYTTEDEVSERPSRHHSVRIGVKVCSGDVVLSALRCGVKEGEAELVGKVDEREQGNALGDGLHTQLLLQCFEFTVGCEGVQIGDRLGDVRGVRLDFIASLTTQLMRLVVVAVRSVHHRGVE